MTSSGKSAMATAQAGRRMQLQKLQKNSGNQRESPSKRQNGQNVMDSFASGIPSMSQTIWNYAVASPLSTMTLRSLDILDAGRH